MTKDEIKQTVSMAEVVGRYGFRPNRAGFISCPFHDGDRQASLKVYKDSFHCFGCGADGDIFSFVQRMEGIGFKEAFRRLGGEGRVSDAALVRIERQKAKKKRRERALRNKYTEFDAACTEVLEIRKTLRSQAPMSERWIDAIQRRDAAEYRADCLLEELFNLIEGR